MAKRKRSKLSKQVPYINFTTPSGSGKNATDVRVRTGLRLDPERDLMHKAWIKDAKKRLKQGKEPREYTFTGTVWLPGTGSASTYDIPED